MSAELGAAVPSVAALGGLVLRVSILIATGMISGWLLRSSSAELRHTLWLATLGGALVLGFVSLTSPWLEWQIHPVYVWSPGPWIEGGVAGNPLAWVLFLTWILGSALFTARLAWGMRAATQLTKRADPVLDPGWLSDLADISQRLRVRQRVELRQTRETTVPASWGIFQPVVVLPVDADSWSSERRRAVLLHELAHVRRRDCLVETLTAIACAVYWFHPGIWWIGRRLRLSREQSCDSMVLQAGMPAADYAEHLVSLLRTAVERRSRPRLVVSLAGRSRLEQRLLSLEHTPSRRSRKAQLAVAHIPLLMSLAVVLWTPIQRVSPPSSGAVSQQRAEKVSRCQCIRRRLAAQSRTGS